MASHVLEDEFVSQFTASTMDVAKFASDAIRSDAIPATVQKLSHKTTQLNAAIKKEVSLHESSLLDQTSHISLLEDALRTARDGVTRIEVATLVVTESLRAPLKLLSDGVVEMERLLHACEIVRLVLRFFNVVSRLQRHMENSQISQAARCLVELAPLEGPESQLALVDEVQKMMPAVEVAKNAVRSKVKKTITKKNFF
jgi:hypothetical protein